MLAFVTESVEFEVDKRMHITSLYLKNIKCFKELTYKFEDDKGASLVIAGDNGDGKSTILRSIAISLCDQWSAAGLLRELSGEFIRDGCKKGVIKLGLISGRKRFEIITVIKWDSKETYEYPYREINRVYKNGRKSKGIDDASFDWKAVFATGYGSGLRTVGTQDFQYYFTGDSIYSLFRDDVTLQNPELAIRRISTSVTEQSTATNLPEQTTIFQEALLHWIGQILILNNKSLEVHGNGIFVCGDDNGDKVPLAAAGDGYKALTALILDMLSWWFLYAFYDAKTGDRNEAEITFDSIDSFKSMNGVVIIDEIEQHLHPKWQSNILPSLEKHFPQVQFIVATHSPLVVSSSEDDVLVLENGQARKEKLYGWLAEDVYIQMGKKDERPPKIAERISEFESLYREKISGTISKQGEERFNSIYEQLKIELPSHDPILQTIKFSVMCESLQDD